jgi:hypothetical protein
MVEDRHTHRGQTMDALRRLDQAVFANTAALAVVILGSAAVIVTVCCLAVIVLGGD